MTRATWLPKQIPDCGATQQSGICSHVGQYENMNTISESRLTIPVRAERKANCKPT